MAKFAAYLIAAALCASIAWAAAGMLTQLSTAMDKAIDRSVLVDVAR